jgi:addiction module HigA family antidote
MNARARKPTHPGALLREDILPAMGMTQREFARRLGVSRRTISEILHERRPITPDMAIRLGRLLNTTPQSWLNMQASVALWELEHGHPETYHHIQPAA